MADKDDVRLGGAAETMLQTLYARAKESQRSHHKIYDAKAVEVVGQLDYDFSAADKDATMSVGVVARTIVLDRMVGSFVAEHPDAVVANVACGMDTRFYRVDNGRIRWVNVDLPETMAVRRRYLPEDGEARVTNVACSAMDAAWTRAVPSDAADVLVVVEGLTMYLSEQDVRQILEVVDAAFAHAMVYMEILNPRFVHKDIERSISQSGAAFTWGAKSGEELARLCPALSWRGDRSLAEGMGEIYPAYRLIGWIPAVRDVSNKIAVLEK